MTDPVFPSHQHTDAHDWDASDDMLDQAIEDIRSAIETGRLAGLATAVDIHDTVESLRALHAADGADTLSAAQYDLALALAGWTPDTGTGVKKALRTVRDYPGLAPRLFDFLRATCVEREIYTSPELVLDRLFDAGQLAAVLETACAQIMQSYLYRRMPAEEQERLAAALQTARARFPLILDVVGDKLDGLRRVQPNSAARSYLVLKNDASARKPPTIRAPDAHANWHDSTAAAPSGHGGNFVELNFHWPDLTPVAGAAYRAVFSDGASMQGQLDNKGFARLEGIPGGQVLVYYGEDPRPYDPAAVQVRGDVTLAALQEELEEFAEESDAEGIDFLLDALAQRHPPLF